MAKHLYILERRAKDSRYWDEVGRGTTKLKALKFYKRDYTKFTMAEAKERGYTFRILVMQQVEVVEV